MVVPIASLLVEVPIASLLVEVPIPVPGTFAVPGAGLVTEVTGGCTALGRNVGVGVGLAGVGGVAPDGAAAAVGAGAATVSSPPPVPTSAASPGSRRSPMGMPCGISNDGAALGFACAMRYAGFPVYGRWSSPTGLVGRGAAQPAARTRSQMRMLGR